VSVTAEAAAVTDVQAALDKFRKALEEIRGFDHAPGCDTGAPVYECGCYEKSQWDIAREALE
jgi:hypothetical protein